MRSALVLANVVLVLIVVVLFTRSRPILTQSSLGHLLFSSSWRPLRGEFGLFAFIVGTVEVTGIAMLIAVPVCLLSAIYLSEYAGPRLREAVLPAADVLAGIPSVVYGLWGVLVVVPFVRAMGEFLGRPTTGYSLLSGGLILAIMVFPIILSVATEVLRSVPNGARESALALGLTRWETARYVVVRCARRGIMAAVVLGFARAFGETLAVLMVVGNVPTVPKSVFDPAYPLPALIANNYGEMMSIPLYDSALLLSAFILLLVIAGFNVMARLVLRGIARI
jgi:phosphate transport system permease protein